MTDYVEMTDDRDAFGYTREPVQHIPVYGCQVAEGKVVDTLEPAVFVYFRDERGNRTGYMLTPDMAEGLAGELERWARRAREKHWE